MRSLPGGRISPVDLRKPPIAQQTTTTTAPPGNASTLSIASSLHDRSLNRSRSKFIWCAFCTSALPCQCCPTTLTQWTSSVANCHIAFMSAAFQAASHLSKTVRTFESLLSSFEAIIAVLRITGSAVGSYQAVIVCICHCRLFLAAAASQLRVKLGSSPACAARPLYPRFCRKTRFAQVVKNSAGRRRGFQARS